MVVDLQETIAKLTAKDKDLQTRLERLEVQDRVTAGALEPETYYGINQVMNYPSLETADGAQPEWWEVQNANITLTEEDATGEGIAQKYERILKCVGGASGATVYFYQRYIHADQPIWDDGLVRMSAGAWIYNMTTGTVTMELYDNGGAAQLANVNVTGTGFWVWAEMNNVLIGTTSTDIRFRHSANNATFYVAMPMINVGSTVRPWTIRGLRYKYYDGWVVVNVDPNGAGWTDVDVTAKTSPITVLATLAVHYLNSTTNNIGIRLRRKGDAASDNYQNVVRNPVTGRYIVGTRNVLLNDSQIFQYYSAAAVGDNEILYISLLGAYEWE